MKDLKLVDQDFTVREIQLAFVLARMRVIDESVPASKTKLANLSQEDFYEALVRVASMKTLPTPAEAKAAGCADGGELYLKLLENPKMLDEWLTSAREAAAQGERQPIHEALDALVHLVIRTIESATAVRNAPGPR